MDNITAIHRSGTRAVLSKCELLIPSAINVAATQPVPVIRQNPTKAKQAGLSARPKPATQCAWGNNDFYVRILKAISVFWC
jgi:hypothetical protein